MPRIARKERERRRKISLGLRRYWRQIRAIAKTEGLSIPQARGVRAGRLLIFPEGFVSPFPDTLQALYDVLAVFLPPVQVEFIPSPEQGEFAFNLKDVDEELSLGIAARFVGRTVTAYLTFTIGRQEYQREVTFAGGLDEGQFWSNYFAGLREVKAEFEAENDIGSSDYGINLNRLAA
jgi:hypothetical protein